MADVTYRFAGIPDGVVASVYAASDLATVLTTVTGTQAGYADTDLPVGDYVAVFSSAGYKHQVAGDLAAPVDVDYARSSTGGGGTSVAPESWLLAFTSADTEPLVGSITLLFDPSGATVVGDDLTLIESTPDSGEFDTVLVSTAGRYRIRVELEIKVDTGSPTGYLFVAPVVRGPVSPSYWSDGNNADGVAVNESLTAMPKAPVPLDTAEAYLPAGTTIQVNPVYSDVADATVKLRSGTSLYVLRTA